MTNHTKTLGEQVEQLVRDHIAGIHRTAAEAVERAFSSSSSSRPKVARAVAKGMGRRRSPAEVAALGERLYEAVLASPGETMAVLAPELGATPRQLHRPMMVLKRAGRVRSVGQRHQSRYFPMAGEATQPE